MTYAAIRVRGTVNIKPDIKKTLKLLNLTRANHCVILEENKVYKGMIQVAKDYVTWGELEKDILTDLISKRGRIQGDKALTDKYLKSSTSYSTIDKLSDAIIAKKFKFHIEYHKVSKTEMASHLNISRSHLHRMLSGERPITDSTRNKMNAYLDTVYWYCLYALKNPSWCT